jgi:hypothetical protein
MNDDKFAGWRKSSYSGDGNSCVELASASTSPMIGVRDTEQYGRGPVLEFSAGAWQEFLGRVRHSPIPLVVEGVRINN